MGYLRTKKMKLVIFIISLFMLFHVGRFIKTRITSISLPKGKIVFSSGLRGNGEIYIMSLNGTNLKRLTRYSFLGPTLNKWISDYQASFSPDGNGIVFKSDRDDKGPCRESIYDSRGRVIGDRGVSAFWKIYIMDIDGRNQTRLTYNQIGNYPPVFSPDSRRILFCSVPSTDEPFYKQIKIINSDGRGERVLIQRRGVGRLAKFSPDSQRVLFVFRGDLYAVDINEGNIARLTYFNPQDIERPRKVEYQPFVDDFCYSSDGKEITFAITERKALQFIFYSMNTDGSGMREITRVNNPDPRGYVGHISGLKYSPDGEKIAFVGDFYLDKNFYVLDRDNNLSLVRNFNFRKIDIKNGYFIFTPNSRQVVFIAALPYGLFDDWFIWAKSVIHEWFFNLKYYILRRRSGPYDNKYICIMDIETGNFRKITRLPLSSQLGRNFIHWEE